MKRITASIVPLLALGIVFSFVATDARAANGKKGIKGMSQAGMMKMARSAAPPRISDNATILLPGPDGKLMEAKKGTNGFTCIPDLDGQEKPDPICADKAATEFIVSMMNKEAKPANKEPGVAYMAQGGWHWEKDGRVVMSDTPGAKRVKEPPHWMMLWPFDMKSTMLPDRPGKFGTYIMFEGTPYAHLMIYQDPNKLGK